MPDNCIDISTQLADFHRRQMTISDGVQGFEVDRDLIGGFVEQLSALPQCFLRCPIEDESQMWSVPPIALLLSDIVLLTGGRVGGIPGKPKMGLLMLAKGARPAPKHLLPYHLRDKMVDCNYGYSYFHETVMLDWLRAAEKFIADGQLLYLPRYTTFSITQGLSDDDQEIVSSAIPEFVSVAYGLGRSSAHPLISSVGTSGFDWKILGIGEASMPFLSGVKLDLLHKVMQDERDALLCFRKAMSDAIATCKELSVGAEDLATVRKVGQELKRDVIYPEVARLKQRFKRIVTTRSVRIAGGVLGLAGLAMAAVSGNSIGASITVLLGAGGAGLIAKEYSDYLGDVLNLKENPWYFAWKLNELKGYRDRKEPHSSSLPHHAASASGGLRGSAHKASSAPGERKPE